MAKTTGINVVAQFEKQYLPCYTALEFPYLSKCTFATPLNHGHRNP